MAEDEGFLGRWSRLKRQAAQQAAQEEAAAAEPSPGREEPNAEPPPAEPAAAAEPFDPATLPPIESLDANSDYRPFMAPEVPDELRRLALRRAWTSNPAIAGFRGLAEYDWDCNAPGYGRLLPSDDLRRLCERVLRDAAAPAEPAGEEIAAGPVDAPPERPVNSPPEGEA